jgi:class 3 adenylate cyclase
VEGNRVLRTVVLTDAAGFTASMRENEPEALRNLAHHLDIVQSELVQNGGQIIKCTGDGYLSVFESSVNAVTACREIQNKLLQSPLRPRIGIHVGEVTLIKDDAFGDAVNLCARLEEMAHPGEIVISGTVNDLLASQTIEKAKNLGQKVLKGIPEAIPVFSWQYGDAPKRKRPYNYTAIFASVILVVVFALLSVKAFNVETKTEDAQTKKLMSDLRARKQDGNSQPESQDIDLIMDEAYAQVLEEVDAFSDAKSEAIKKLDAGIVLKWLDENPYGKRERGQLEIEHWTLVDLAIQEGKKLAGTVATPDQIKTALSRSKKPADTLALKAFNEEFFSVSAK